MRHPALTSVLSAACFSSVAAAVKAATRGPASERRGALYLLSSSAGTVLFV